jgi:maleamate amidohydrolase
MKARILLDRGRTALLLIDFQEEQRYDPNYSVAGFEMVLANARQLLLAARRWQIGVFHAAYKRDFAVSPPRPFEPLTANGAPAFSNKASPLTAICEEVQPAIGEWVIHKNDASAFSEGTLQAALAKADIEWLIVAGVWSEACVAATVRDAIMNGLRVLLVKDACGSGTEAMHQTAVLNIANRLYGGAVADSSRALQLMSGEEAEVWMPSRPVPVLFQYSDAADLYASL